MDFFQRENQFEQEKKIQDHSANVLIPGTTILLFFVAYFSKSTLSEPRGLESAVAKKMNIILVLF